MPYLQVHIKSRGRVVSSFLRCIRKVLGPKLGPETGYPESGFSWFSSVPPSEFLDSTLKLGHNSFLPNPNSSSFIYHRRYIVYLLKMRRKINYRQTE
jgi:hypothetical protein